MGGKVFHFPTQGKCGLFCEIFDEKFFWGWKLEALRGCGSFEGFVN
jgi:hypothetical protein